jgi:hypothetical protein
VVVGQWIGRGSHQQAETNRGRQDSGVVAERIPARQLGEAGDTSGVSQDGGVQPIRGDNLAFDLCALLWRYRHAADADDIAQVAMVTSMTIARVGLGLSHRTVSTAIGEAAVSAGGSEIDSS